MGQVQCFQLREDTEAETREVSGPSHSDVVVGKEQDPVSAPSPGPHAHQKAHLTVPVSEPESPPLTTCPSPKGPPHRVSDPVKTKDI